MPCSSTDDGAWGGTLTTSPLARETDASTAMVAGRTEGSRRPQQRQHWEGDGPKAATWRLRCSSLPGHVTDNSCRDPLTSSAVALDGTRGFVAGVARNTNSSVVPLNPFRPLMPMQVASATIAAREVAQDERSDRRGSDGESDLDFFTPLSSPLREFTTPPLPVAGVMQTDSSDEQQQHLTQQRSFTKFGKSGVTATSLLPGTSVDDPQHQSTSTSSLPTTKGCGLLLGRFPLRRRHMSADCGSSFMQQTKHHHSHIPVLEPEAAAAAGLHLLAKTVASAAAKDKVALTSRIARPPVPSRCIRRPIVHDGQKRMPLWVQQHQPQNVAQPSQQHRSQQGLQREAADEELRMPLVPPPAPLSPLLARARVAPPTMGCVPAYSEDAASTAPTAVAPDASVTTGSREAATGCLQPLSVTRSVPAVREETQLLNEPPSNSLLTSCRQQDQQEAPKQQQYACQEQDQQQEQECDKDESVQCAKRRRFSVERNASTCSLPYGQAAIAIPPVSTTSATESSDSSGSQLYRNQERVEQATTLDELHFSSHRKRKRGECSTRQLLMLQPHATAADAALLDVLGTALTAEETRELRMQQQKEAEEAAAAAAAAAEVAARERTAAAAAAEASAARAVEVAAAEEATSHAKVQLKAAQGTAVANTPVTIPTSAGDPQQSTLLVSGSTAAVAPRPAAACTPLFGSAKPTEPQPLQQQQQQPQRQQLQQQPPQSQQLQQRTPHSQQVQQQAPQSQQLQQQAPQSQQLQQQAPQSQQLQALQPQQLQGTPASIPTSGDLSASHARPKLRIRRANGPLAGAAAGAPAAGPGASTAAQASLGISQQQQQVQQQFGARNPVAQQQSPHQQQMDVQGPVFQVPQAQLHQQRIQQAQLQPQLQQPASGNLGLGLAEFGPTKLTEVADGGSNPFAFVAGRGRGRGGRRGGVRRR
ncbi:hypothetical protein, conserved [Eimeria tenella]|uniref:Uncharacterized protein n=1 Tax=Eimeria tenella TaxID=5802 RepID=U6KYS6_EIMTE|nr:hypothetical protein, conserved [Eimeria tenella]CDJ43116.1 hypothetical protein, conserved [Eimeria tenella]|eukprot:XP_013233866.1 hypothetical protein, conserved [Eimeria tenella]